MKIHIVCTNYTNDRILSRLSVGLAKELGYSIGEKPSESADLNYAFPYIELRKFNRRFAALFTHREDTVPEKVALWKEQLQKASIRTTFAKMYYDELAQYGQTYIVTPPLDRSKFRPIISKIRSGKPKIGVSGFTYGGGRKGEGLITQILKRPIAQEFEWVATGRGWPITTQHYSWDKMQEFYWGLDVYLCSSIIEGVPYPPLEAMACGKRCVIPKGVGILDELPNMPDLIRYNRGDVDSMEEALKKALIDIDKTDITALRDATSKYTLENWTIDHLKAFENYGEVDNVEPKVFSLRFDDALQKSEVGIYTVAYGAPSRKCASKLIDSIRKYMPNIPVAVCSDQKLGTEDFFVEYPDSDIGGRTAKIKVYDLAPKHWKYILYVDSDVVFSDDVSFLFNALKDGWEMVISKDVDQYSVAFDLFRRDNDEGNLALPIVKTNQILALAGGMISFKRCENTERFFHSWYYEWKKLARRDQGALLRAYYQYPVKLLVVGNEWNSINNFFDIKKTAGVEHYNGGPARRWTGAYPGRLDNFKSNINIFHSGKDITEEDLEKTCECIAKKSFLSNTKMIRRGGNFFASGEHTKILVDTELAFCISFVDKEMIDKEKYISM